MKGKGWYGVILNTIIISEQHYIHTIFWLIDLQRLGKGRLSFAYSVRTLHLKIQIQEFNVGLSLTMSCQHRQEMAKKGSLRFLHQSRRTGIKT